jgi:hypothetical protein
MMNSPCDPSSGTPRLAPRSILSVLRTIAEGPTIAYPGRVTKIRHIPTFVRLAVKDAGDGGDGCFRHDLFYKNDAAAEFVLGLAFDVEPEIHFLKIDMKRYEKIHHSRIEEHKTDEANEAFAVLQIKLGTDGNTGP